MIEDIFILTKTKEMPKAAAWYVTDRDTGAPVGMGDDPKAAAKDAEERGYEGTEVMAYPIYSQIAADSWLDAIEDWGKPAPPLPEGEEGQDDEIMDALRKHGTVTIVGKGDEDAARNV